MDGRSTLLLGMHTLSAAHVWLRAAQSGVHVFMLSHLGCTAVPAEDLPSPLELRWSPASCTGGNVASRTRWYWMGRTKNVGIVLGGPRRPVTYFTAMKYMRREKKLEHRVYSPLSCDLPLDRVPRCMCI